MLPFLEDVAFATEDPEVGDVGLSPNEKLRVSSLGSGGDKPGWMHVMRC